MAPRADHDPGSVGRARKAARPGGRWRLLLALLAALSLVAAACGDDDDTASGDATTTTAAGTATSSGGGTTGGAADESLDPLVIGFINQEGGATGVYPELSVAQEAAVEYINTELGGLDGHPIELSKCIVDGTVPSSQKCAEEMVNEGVTFVMGGLDNNSQAWYSILEPAGIPLIGGVPVTPGDFNSTDAHFFIAGGAAAYAGLAAYILEFMPDAKSVGIIANDSPGAAAALPLVTKPLEAGGVEVSDVKVPTTQSDWLAPFASVRDKDAAAVLVAPPNCVSLAQARNSQQSDLTMVSVSSCYSKTVLDGAGAGGLDGWVVNQYFDDPQGETEDATTYREVMATYAPADANLSGFAPVVFSDMMTVYDSVLTPLGFEGATTEAIVEKVKDPAGGKVFMGPDYKCGVAGAPFVAVCNYQLQWFKVAGGKLTEPTGFVDVTETIKIGNT